MIQNPQKKQSDDLRSSASKAIKMPPFSASKTQYLFHGKSSENLIKNLVSTTLCLSSCENPKKRKMNSDDPKVSCRSSDYKLTKEERKIARMRSLSNEERAEEERDHVSTELTLFKDPWIIKKANSDDPKVSCRPSDYKFTKEERKIARMRRISNEERVEDQERDHVSTELTLFKDPWIIKKVLTTSDLGQLSRLLLQTSPIEDHIIKYLNNDDKNMVQEGLGLTVDVYDHDTDSTLELLLKRWTTMNSYVLNGGWRMYFVRRRDLRKGDEIGLFWDRFASRLHFRVLSRAAT